MACRSRETVPAGLTSALRDNGIDLPTAARDPVAKGAVSRARSAEVLQRAKPLDLGVAGRSADRAAAWDTDELKTSSCVADGSGMCWCPRHAAAETLHVDSSNERSNDAGRLAPAAVYRRFLDALNRQDLTEAEACVDRPGTGRTASASPTATSTGQMPRLRCRQSGKAYRTSTSSFTTSPTGRTSRSPAAP